MCLKFRVESIISEKQLTERFGVSKSPVREALVELCSQGVLKSIPRQGYAVVRLSERNIRDILALRTMVECGCLTESFDDITPTQICRLESIVENEFLFLTRSDSKDYWSGTMNFHLTLASFSENEYIYGQLRTALNTSMRAYLQLYPERWRDGSFMQPSALHLEIVRSIRDGDREAAIEFLRKDISTFRTL